MVRAVLVGLAVLVPLTVFGIATWGVRWAVATYAGALLGTAIVVVPLLISGRLDE
jgi:hypothetical protein